MVTQYIQSQLTTIRPTSGQARKEGGTSGLHRARGACPIVATRGRRPITHTGVGAPAPCPHRAATHVRPPGRSPPGILRWASVARGAFPPEHLGRSPCTCTWGGEPHVTSHRSATPGAPPCCSPASGGGHHALPPASLAGSGLRMSGPLLVQDVVVGGHIRWSPTWRGACAALRR